MQPIRITRSEYEAKFGTKPVVSTSTFDTTPAPIRITRSEYEAKFGGDTAKANFRQDWRQLGQSVGQGINDTQSSISRVRDRVESGEVSPTKGTFQTLGMGLGGGLRTLANAGLGLAKLITPESVEKKVAETAQGTSEAIGNYNRDFKTSLDTSTKPAEQDVAKRLDEFGTLYKTDETFRTDVDSAGGFANAVLSFIGAGPAGTVVSKTADIATDVTKRTVTPISEIVPKLPKATFTKTPDERLSKVVDELAGIESGYNALRKKATYSKDIDASRRRIAESNVLEGAVSEDGVIDGLYAAKRYKETQIGDSGLTLNDVEDVVKRNLENENKTINLKEIEATLKANIFDAGLEGADLVTAINGLKNELKGLSLRADGLEDIPLAKLHDVKISTTDKINYATPPTEQVYRKAVARTYKDLIERKSDVEVKTINAELSKYYEDIDRLKSLDGKRTKGGRLGKYQAAIVGTGVGMAGGSVGGGAGAAIGGLAGAELAAKLQGKAMARTFKTGLDGAIPENRILADAKASADAGKKIDLRIPDEPKGAPAGIAKTPEITKLEAQIAKNVKDQKAAIKAGDFTLVAALKEIYQALVQKLKEQVDFIKSNAKDQSGFAKVPFTGGNQKTPRDFMTTKAINPPNNANTISSKVSKDTTTVNDDVVDSMVLENLMRIDALDTDPADTFRFLELQKAANSRPLTESELLEARAIVENAEGKLPEVDTWTGTESSRPSKVDNTSTSKKPTGKEGVSGQSVDTLGDFAGGSLLSEAKKLNVDDTKKYFQLLPQSYLKTPKVVYRGVSEGGEGLGASGGGAAVEGYGLYTTTKKSVAQGYATHNGQKGRVLELEPADSIPQNPLYFRNSDGVKDWTALVSKELGINPRDFETKVGINNLIKELGYDGVAFDMNGGVTYVKYPD